MPTQTHLSEEIGLRQIVKTLITSSMHMWIKDGNSVNAAVHQLVSVSTWTASLSMYALIKLMKWCAKNNGAFVSVAYKGRSLTRKLRSRVITKKNYAVKCKKASCKTLGTNPVNSDPDVELSNDSKTIDLSPDLENVNGGSFLTQGTCCDAAAGENLVDLK
jgi:hypothetical protein